MCMHTDDAQPGLGEIVKAVSRMNTRELDRLQRAIDDRRADAQQTIVSDRRSYRDGILQLEHHRNPATGHVGPGYWYYRYREGGRQHSLYVGKTAAPEKVVDKKLDNGDR